MAQAKATRTRLTPELFDLPVEKMRAGWYTDAYFNHAAATLLKDGRHPDVLMQVFQKQHSWLGGMDEAISECGTVPTPRPPHHDACSSVVTPISLPVIWPATYAA